MKNKQVECRWVTTLDVHPQRRELAASERYYKSDGSQRDDAEEKYPHLEGEGFEHIIYIYLRSLRSLATIMELWLFRARFLTLI